MPEVSIIIPTHNRSQRLKRAVDSVLAQDYKDFELIIVDDGSTDGTEKVVAGYDDLRIKYIRWETNSGGSGRPRRYGVSVAQGRYVAQLDADRYWLNTKKLSLQVAFLEQNPNYVIVGTMAQTGDGYRIRLPSTDAEIRGKLLQQNCFIHSSVMYRRDTVLQTGNYEIISDDHRSGYSNDYDLWLRLGLLGMLHNLPIYATSYERYRIGYNERMRRQGLRLETIEKYKDSYPNYKQASRRQVLATMLTVIATEWLPPYKVGSWVRKVLGWARD